MKNTTYFSSVTCSGSEDVQFDENHNWRKMSAFNFGGFIWSKLLVNIPHLEPTAGRKHQANGHNPTHTNHDMMHWHFVNRETTDKTMLQQDAVFLQVHFNTLQYSSGNFYLEMVRMHHEFIPCFLYVVSMLGER